MRCVPKIDTAFEPVRPSVSQFVGEGDEDEKKENDAQLFHRKGERETESELHTTLRGERERERRQVHKRRITT